MQVHLPYPYKHLPEASPADFEINIVTLGNFFLIGASPTIEK